MKPGYISIYALRTGLYKIRETAQKTGLTQRAIRYYESLGLISPTKRSRGKIRLYTEADCQRLLEIKKLRDTGLSLAEIPKDKKLAVQTVIFIDSAFSVSVQQAAAYGVQLVPDTIQFGASIYKDYTTLSPEQFVAVEKRKRSYPISEPPAVDEYIKLFSEAFTKGCNELVSLHPDQRLSRSYERALAAAKALPQLPIKVIDTQLMSIGLRYVLEKTTPHMSAMEIQKLIEQLSGSITEFVLLGSLEHLSSAQDTLGSMLFSYVPILQHTPKDGLLPVARLDSLDQAVKYLNENIQGFSQYRAGFSSFDFYKSIKPKLKKLTITTAYQYSSVLMANFGRKLFGVAVLR